MTEETKTERRYAYIAGPYTQGDPVANTRRAVEFADRLMCRGWAVFCPHLSMFHHFLRPKLYEEWMNHCLAWVRKCDVLFRLPGESPGADREVALAEKLGIHVARVDTLESGYTPSPRMFEKAQAGAGQFVEVEDALAHQVGGSHYKDMAIQPIEFTQKNKLGFCEGNVLKYICRHRAKNGKADLEKAKHYIDLLIEAEYPEKGGPDVTVSTS